MIEVALTELRLLRRNPVLAVLLFVLPILLISVLSPALAPVYPVANPYQATIPGFAVMFAFYGSSFVADAFMKERTWGNWPRLLTSGIPRRSLVAGKVLAPVLIVWTQLTMLVVLGSVVHDVSWGPWWLVAVAVLVTGVGTCGLGTALAAIARDQAILDQLSNLVAVGGGALGGCIVPASQLPDWLRAVSPVLPQYWAVQAFDAARTQDPSLVWWSLLLVVTAALLTGVGVLGLRTSRLLEPIG